MGYVECAMPRGTTGLSDKILSDCEQKSNLMRICEYYRSPGRGASRGPCPAWGFGKSRGNEVRRTEGG